MVDSNFDLSTDVKEELQLLQAQLEHSRNQRRKRELRKEKEKEKEREKEKEKEDVVSVAGSDGAASTATNSTTATSFRGQTVVKKVGRGVTLQTATRDEQPQAATPENPAELKRQRELKQEAKKRQAEEEAAARLAAQKSDPAAEKGGNVSYFVKGAFGRSKKVSGFAVVRKAGIFFYSKEPRGRGSTAGGVRYDPDAKADVVIPFLVETKNSRGSTVPKKSFSSSMVDKSQHPSADKQDRQFGINFFDAKTEKYSWHLIEVESPQEKSDWLTFISKFI